MTIASQPASFFEVAIGHEVFGERTGIPDWHYDHQVCTPDASTSVARGPLLTTAAGLELTEMADTIIVAGGESSGPADRRIVEAVRTAAERGARVMSFCTGAFVLAETGLLDGLEVTTHHKYAERLQQRFPAVRVNPDVLFIDHGRIATSAGTTAGIDLALHIVRRDLGAEAARLVAHDMVLSTQRAGHQAQRVVSGAKPLIDGDPIAPLLDWLVEHLHERMHVSEMARRVAMSERTFARRFKEVTGTTPVRWLTDRREARSLELLETTTISIDEIARMTGFSSTSKLREQLRVKTGMSPTEYRRAANGRCEASTSVGGHAPWSRPVYGESVPSGPAESPHDSADHGSPRELRSSAFERPAS